MDDYLVSIKVISGLLDTVEFLNTSDVPLKSVAAIILSEAGLVPVPTINVSSNGNRISVTFHKICSKNSALN